MATPSRERRGEIPLAGLGVQERLLPTLNAVLMPSTTGLPPQLQRRTCSRNRFSSFSALLIVPSRFRSRPLSSSRRVFSALLLRSNLLFAVSRSLVHDLRLDLFSRFLSLFCISNASFSSSFVFFLPCSGDFFFSTRVSSLLPRSLSSSPILRLAGSFNLSRLYFCTHSFSSIDTFSPYCRSRGRCA